MKKYLAILAATLMLTSCSNVIDNKAPNNTPPGVEVPQQGGTVPSQNTPADQTETEDLYFGQYQMSDDGFSQYVKDNAIDKDYEIESTKFQTSPEFNTQGWVELEGKYKDLWDKELNNTYTNLLKKLNKEEQEKLREAQKGWLDFHINESEFVSASWDELELGTMGRVQLIMAAKDRLRERTLQFMEYYFMLGGEIEFLYQGTSK